jgi:hypothetical protein
MPNDRTVLALRRYRKHAAGYDASAERTEPLRRRTIEKLAREATMLGMGYIA